MPRGKMYLSRTTWRYFFRALPELFSLDLHVTFKSMYNVYGVTLNEAFTADCLDSTYTINISF